MQIRLRVANDAKVTIVDNRIFSPLKSLVISLFPIPEWIKDAKCKCDTSGKYLLGDMSFICQNCLNKLLSNANKLEKIKDTDIPLARDTLRGLKFEWSPDGERWYRVRYIKPKNWDRFLSQLKKCFINNDVIMVEAEYFKETKELIIS